MPLSFLKRKKKRRTHPMAPLEPLEARALLSAVISVAGNTHGIAAGDVTPSALDFTDFGYMSTIPSEANGQLKHTFTITNTGDQPLDFTGIGNFVQISGANAGDFTLNGDVNTPLNPGSSESFTITFAPSAAGLRQATVTIQTNDANSPFTCAIQGTGIATTDFVDGLQIATITPGAGTSSAIVSGSAITADYSGYLMNGVQFQTTVGGTPFNAVVGRGSLIAGWEEGLIGMKVGETRLLIIPGALAYPNGQSLGSITIPAGAPLLFTVTLDSLSQADLIIKGNGNLIPSGDVTPSLTDFTDFGVASTTTSTNGTITRTFTITNTSSADLTITSMPTISGLNASEFTVTANPNTTILAGSSSTFTVSFSPQDTGLRIAQVTVASNDPDQPNYTFDVGGTGITTINSTTGLMMAITTTGSGLAALPGSKVSVNFTGTLFTGPIFASATDPNAPGDLVIGNPGVIAGLNEGLTGIRPGESRTLFIPASLAYGAAGFGAVPPNTPIVYTITALNVQAPAIDMNVVGNGTNIADGDITPSLLDFTDFGYVSTTASNIIGPVRRTFQIANDGGIDLVLTGNPSLVSITGPNAADFVITSAVASPNVAAGTASSFTITFTPHGTGTRTATVTIPSNDPDNPSYHFTIRGTGIDTINATNGLMIGTITPSSSTASAFLGAVLTVNYTGLLTSGLIFDSSDPTINPGRTPFSFTLGVHNVIEGWEEGMVGLKPGEQRVLIIPGALAYPNGQGNIPAGAPLIFIITGVSQLSPILSVVNNNNTPIVNGDKTPTIDDFTDFREMSFTPDNSTNSPIGVVHRTFYVTDNGSGAIFFNGAAITVSGANASDFTVASQAQGGAANGGFSPFTINFTPHGSGKRTAVITVHPADPAAAVYSFAVQGTGVKTSNATNFLEQGLLVAGNHPIVHSQTSVLIDYSGWLLDGTIAFDSAGGSPLQMLIPNTVSGVISSTILGNATDGSGTLVPSGTLLDGMVQGLQGIKAGETRLLVIPSALGFGASANGNIPANSTLLVKVTAEPHELVVFANGTLISPGSTASSAGNFTLLGNIPTGSNATQLSHIFQLQGGGNDLPNLNLTSFHVPITGPGASAFKSTTISFDTISGTHFVITFAPPKPGTYSAIAHVKSNDPIHPDYTFTITATQTPWTELTPTLKTINFPASGAVTSGDPTAYTIPVSITNNGNTAVSGTASATDFKVFLHNTNSTSNASDILISTSTTTALRSLGAHASKTINLSVPIPVTVDAGTYQVIVKYNSNGSIPELSTSNNTATYSHNITVTKGQNDLAAVLGPIALPAGGVLSGSATPFTLPVTVTNNGNITLGATPIKFNVYLHDTVHNTFTLIASPTSTALNSLAVGASTKVNLSVTLPVTVPAGSYEFQVRVNEDTAIPETNLANNNSVYAHSFNASQGIFDITAAIGSTAFAANTPIVSGAPTLYKIPVTITNNGNLPIAADAAPVNVKIYAHNATSGTDTLILSTTTTALRKLAVGKSITLTLNSALPLAVTSGEFEFRVVVNDNTAIPDLHVADNDIISAQTFSVTQGVYNIAGNLSTSTFLPSVVHGTAITGKMTVTVSNTGNLTLPSNQKINLQLVVIASDDSVIPIGAITSASVANFAPGKSTTVSLSKSLAAGLSTLGTYLLAVQLSPTPALVQNTLDDLFTQTAGNQAYHINVT